jgi:O-antigen ligase
MTNDKSLKQILKPPFVGLLIIAVGIAIAILPLNFAGIIVIGCILILVTLIRPDFGLYLLIFAIPFGSIKEIRVAGFTVRAAEGLVALILAGWLARMIWEREVRTIHPSLLLPLLIFFGAILLSLTGTLSIRWSLKEIIKWLEVLAIYLFVVNTVDGKMAEVIVVLILLAGIGQALLGWYQFFGGVGPEAFLIIGRFIRAYGTFRQPNPYGGYLGLVFPLAYAILISDLRAEFGWRWRLVTLGISIAALFLIGIALVMTWSRGAWFGAVSAFIAVNMVRSRRAAVLFSTFCLLFASLLVLGGFQLLPEALLRRLTDFLPYVGIFDVRGVKVTDENYAIVERMAHWQAAWEMFKERPWLGVGIGNYEPVYPAYSLPGWKEPLGHAHNYYLNIAAEAGLVGLFAYLILWGSAFWQALKAIRRSEGFWRGVAVGIFGVLVHLSAHNLFDNLYVQNMYVHIAILLGLIHVINTKCVSE